MSLLHQLEVAADAGANGTIEVLRNIKNLVTGQAIRKIEYIRAGIVPVLSKILNNSSAIQADDKRCALWTECAHILSVISHGGPSFVEPILRSEIPDLLVRCLNAPTEDKCTLTVLRCLNSICDNLPLASSENWTADKTLAKLLQTSQAADSLTKLSSATGTGLLEQRISDTALALINKTAQDAKSRTLLVRAGLLESLSKRLASFILAEALAIPQAQSQVDDDILSTVRPPSPAAHLSPVLETISLLIDDSSTLALETFLRNPVLSKILDWSQKIAPQTARSRPIWGTPKTSLQRTTYLDSLLPSVPEADAHKDLGFPPLGQPDNTPRRLKSATRSSRDARLEEAVTEIEINAESPVIPYLMVVVRSSSGRRRCAAAHLLSTLYSFGAVGPTRARDMAALLVPILVDMIEKAYKIRPTSPNERTLTGYPCYWLAPFTLARLVRDNVVLQVAAHEAQAIQALTAALRANFEKARDKPSSLWWPQRLSLKTTEGVALHCLGLGGPNLEARHEMHFREGLLQALASIAPSNDAYRTAICDQGAMSQIILALAPFESTVVSGKSEDSLVVQGNSAQTLLAACSTVRALTRSPTALRTKLVDADVAKSVVKLLHYNEVEVRIAATAIVANLAHDFSPMKPTVSEPEIVRRLCEQAHSAHPRLRFESIFALKCLVTRSSNKLKKMIVDGLGASWIAHLLATDPRDVPSGEIIGLDDKEYRKGTNVRTQAEEMDVVMDDSESGVVDPVEGVRNTHTLHDDFEILEQLLGFVRNLFTGDNSSEIIEHFLAEIGYEELVQILIERLKDRSRQSSSSSSYRKAPSSTATSTAPPRGISEHTMYILVHLSAADPKWKTLIIQSDTLLKTIHTHFSSADEKIRVACCWATINLLWTTNSESSEVAAERARVLVRRGFLDTCRRLERGDESVDVRERAKTVVQCFGKLGAG